MTLEGDFHADIDKCLDIMHEGFKKTLQEQDRSLGLVRRLLYVEIMDQMEKARAEAVRAPISKAVVLLMTQKLLFQCNVDAWSRDPTVAKMREMLNATGVAAHATFFEKSDLKAAIADVFFKCPICMEDYEQGELYVILHCGHNCHEVCQLRFASQSVKNALEKLPKAEMSILEEPERWTTQEFLVNKVLQDSVLCCVCKTPGSLFAEDRKRATAAAAEMTTRVAKRLRENLS